MLGRRLNGPEVDDLVALRVAESTSGECDDAKNNQQNADELQTALRFSGSARIGPSRSRTAEVQSDPFCSDVRTIRSGGWSKERRMFSTRSARILSLAVILAPALAAQVPSAS